MSTHPVPSPTTTPANHTGGPMSTMTPVPADAPLMIAWKAYRGTPEYANTKQWAAHEEHVEGSLWAAFVAGFTASHTERLPPGQYRDTAGALRYDGRITRE